jgi:hypothetical protein
MPRTIHSNELTGTGLLRARLVAALAVTIIAAFVLTTADLIVAGIRPNAAREARREARATHILAGVRRAR